MYLTHCCERLFFVIHTLDILKFNCSQIWIQWKIFSGFELLWTIYEIEYIIGYNEFNFINVLIVSVIKRGRRQGKRKKVEDKHKRK